VKVWNAKVEVEKLARSKEVKVAIMLAAEVVLHDLLFNWGIVVRVCGFIHCGRRGGWRKLKWPSAEQKRNKCLNEQEGAGWTGRYASLAKEGCGKAVHASCKPSDTPHEYSPTTS
jgi:hypothetical protein